MRYNSIYIPFTGPKVVAKCQIKKKRLWPKEKLLSEKLPKHFKKRHQDPYCLLPPLIFWLIL